MELLKAFKSPFSSRVGKKNLLSTYSKILFRFNFLRLPYPPRVAGGLWSDGVGCDACCYPYGVLRLHESG